MGAAAKPTRNIDVALARMPVAESPERFRAALTSVLEATAAADGMPDERRGAIIGTVLAAAHPAYRLFLNDAGAAREFLAKLWNLTAETPDSADGFGMAESVASEERQTGGRAKLRRLAVTLGLGQDELGRMCGGVAGETIRRWVAGKVSIPEVRLAQLDQHCARLDEMERIFLPHRIVPATRRNAAIFDGQSAIEWILNGRWTEVIQKYESALAF